MEVQSMQRHSCLTEILMMTLSVMTFDDHIVLYDQSSIL